MSSSTISKKLFENAEFVSSNDPDVDHDNIVFMDSDSESSEKFNYDLHSQQTSLQEVVRADKGEADVAIDITDNLSHHFSVKQEEEFIIDDVPYQIDSDTEIDSADIELDLATANKTVHRLKKDIKKDEEDEDEINFEASTSFGGNSEICITRISPPLGIHPPSIEYSELDEDQFELIPDSVPESLNESVIEVLGDSATEPVENKEGDIAQAITDNSLVDHQYSQPEATNKDKEFCDELVQDLLKETGNFGNPAIVPLLMKFTELFSHFVEDDTNSQTFLYINSMAKTLDGFKKRLALDHPSTSAPSPAPVQVQTPAPVELPTEELGKLSTQQSPLSEQRWQESLKGELEDTFEILGTQPDEDEDVACNGVEVEVDEKMNTEVKKEKVQPENEIVGKLKIDINKINDFATKLSETSSELTKMAMDDDDTIADAKMKLLSLADNSYKEYQKLVTGIRNQFGDKVEILKAEERKKKKLIKEMLDLSDYITTSDSDSDQILNLNRKIQGNGPQTPAVVSSTKDDTDLSETEANQGVASRASSVESGLVKEKDHGKEVERLLDLAALNFAKPASSKKVSKQKKLLKRKKKRSSDIDSIFGSSDGDNAEIDSSSSNDDRVTSDEEQQMLLRQNADIKNNLLAGSESSAVSDGDESDFGFSTSDDEHEKKSKKATQEAKVQKMDVDELDKSLSETEECKEKAAAVDTSTPPPPPPTLVQSPMKKSVAKVEAVSLVSDDDDDDDDDDDQQKRLEQSPRNIKNVRLNSVERDIFSKDYMEINGGNNKKETSTSSSSKTASTRPKTEILSPSKPPNPQGTIDVSMFENRRAAKEFDLEKMIEKRHFPNEPSTSSSPAAHNSAKPSPMIINDDECISLSSDSDSEIIAPTRFPKRKKMLTEEELQEETKKANKDEDQRVKRLEKKNKVLTQMLSQRLSQGSDSDDELILDYDPKKKVTIAVHPKLVRRLKDHQREGIKFMYDTCYGSIADEVKTESGCILAHCMGLGKTLQLITLLHTLIMHPNQLKTSRVLVICPKSTIANWYEEFKKWIEKEKIASRDMKIAFLDDHMKFADRVQRLESDFNENRPVVTLINYEAFRNMILYSDTKRAKMADQKEVKRLQDIIDKCFLSGPDLVVCDEGHLIKNQTGATNRAITKIVTKRRIILTGTPVQNNLNEYYAMVDFIKPALLGTVKEFNNLYANPIKDGQHIDSDKSTIKKMKQRSFILNKKLSKLVQRKEASVLREYLPEKYEYCIFVPLTRVQENLYETFLRKNPLDGGHKLLNDYTALRKIWTHPKVLQNAYDRAWKGELMKDQKLAKKRARDDVENDQPDDLLDSFDGSTGVKSKWWKDLVSEDDLESLLSSNKFILLFEILRQCKERNEKVLVFSAFVAVLNVVEEFMRRMYNQATNPNASKYGYSRYKQPWLEGVDYYRLDGSTKREARQQMIERFNDKKNTRMCCFLISARAGGQGINLIGANRCVILDTSWNPSADQQNIFRIYRLGQEKVCYVYRLIALGTMEEKVYSRSVTKQAMSGRVVDKQQIDRHYRMDELSELYVLTKFDANKRQAPKMPADEVLQYLLFHCPLQAFQYHDHDSLLENKPEQDLNEDEINEAWQLYEQESRGPVGRMNMPGVLNGNLPPYHEQLKRQQDLATFNLLNNLGTSESYNYMKNLAYTQAPFYAPHDYLQSILNISSGAFLNNLAPPTSLASTSVPSTSTSAGGITTSLLQNVNSPFGSIANSLSAWTDGNGKVVQSAPNRRQSTSKAKAAAAERQAMMKQFQGESIHRFDAASTSRKNSLENVSILPDNETAGTRTLSANPVRHARFLDIFNDHKIPDVRRIINTASLSKTPTSVALNKVPSAPGTAQTVTRVVTRLPERNQRLLSASPSPSTSTSTTPNRVPIIAPSTQITPSLTSTISPQTVSQVSSKEFSFAPSAQGFKNKIFSKNLPKNLPSRPASMLNNIRSPSNNSLIHVLQKAAKPGSTNIASLSHNTLSNSVNDLSKNQRSTKNRYYEDLSQLPRPNQAPAAKEPPLNLSPLSRPSRNPAAKEPLLTLSELSQLKSRMNPAPAVKVPPPPPNLSQRTQSSTSLNSQKPYSSKNISRSSADIRSVEGPSKKIVMSPMMSQSARTSAAAPVNVKYVQPNAIKPPQQQQKQQQIQIPQSIMNQLVVSKVSSKPVPTTAVSSRSVIQEASQNNIPQRDPKGNLSGGISQQLGGQQPKKIHVDPNKKTAVTTKVPASNTNNKETRTVVIRPKQQVTFNNALSKRPLQTAKPATQEISVNKISKTIPTINTQQPSTSASVIRTASQKRPGETLMGPAAKRPNQAAKPLKITRRDESDRTMPASLSRIEDIVEIE